MSISTKRGDAGETGLAGGIRISKADLRVESYGTVDELNTVLGFARSICKNEEIAGWTEQIQKTLFRLGSALATPPESKKPQVYITAEDVDFLTQLVYKNLQPMRSRALYAGGRNAQRCGWRRAGRRSSPRCWLT